MNAVTQQGKRAVGRLLMQQQQQQQLSQGQQQHQQQQCQLEQHEPHAETSTTASTHTNNIVSNDPDVAFMLMLAQLQRWKKRHGSCHVPAGVSDKAGLAGWVQHIRQLANTAASSSRSSRNSSSSQGTRGDGVVLCANLPELKQTEAQQQQQQQGQAAEGSAQTQLSCDAPVNAAQPSLQLQHLQDWHLKELNATGFVWQPSQVGDSHASLRPAGTASRPGRHDVPHRASEKSLLRGRPITLCSCCAAITPSCCKT